MEVRNLADRIARTSPDDRDSLTRLVRVLAQLKQRVDDPGGEDRERLDAALTITRLLATSTDAGQEEDVRVVARLIAGLRSADAPPAEEPASDDTRPEGTPLPMLQTELRLASEMTLGDVLLQMKAVGGGQIQDALREQIRTREPLGTILVRQGAIRQTQLETALRHQKDERNHRRDPEPTTPEITCSALATDCLLGEVLVRRGCIDAEDLERALRVHRAAGIRLGEALVELGLSDWNTVERALEIQAVSRR